MWWAESRLSVTGPLQHFCACQFKTQKIKLYDPVFRFTESCDLVVIAITACCVINQSISKTWKNKYINICKTFVTYVVFFYLFPSQFRLLNKKLIQFFFSRNYSKIYRCVVNDYQTPKARVSKDMPALWGVLVCCCLTKGPIGGDGVTMWPTNRPIGGDGIMTWPEWSCDGVSQFGCFI